MVLNEVLKINVIFEDSVYFDDEGYNINNYKLLESNLEEVYLLKEEIEEFKKFLENNFSKFEKEVLIYLIRGYLYREIVMILFKNLKSIDNII